MKRVKQDRVRAAGFTLLELLVVVAILAIIAGGLLVAYDGLQSQSAKGQAAHTIASLESSVRTFTAATRTAPNELDSLVAIADPGSMSSHPSSGTLIGSINAKLAGKITVTKLTNAQGLALFSAGITRLRYIDAARNETTGTGLNNILLADIPNRIFDDNDPSRNRGRGYEVLVNLGSSHDIVAAVWNPGTSPVGVNNTKLGALADDVLVAFGLGNNSTMVGTGDITNVGNVTLSQAPVYGDVQKYEYGRYILLYNVGGATLSRSVAKLQAVVDTRGDFLDEEIAEYSGQKQ